MMKWEYLTESVADVNPLWNLQQIGAEGWELVSVVLSRHQMHFYFKRPLPRDRNEPYIPYMTETPS